jgi:hypothetical protein
LSQRDNCYQRAASVPLASYGQVPENRQQDAGGTLLSQRDNCHLSRCTHHLARNKMHFLSRTAFE